ncbi:hypothetical protein ACRALDRAFT_2038303 [Sodiomyces alcalophilus JCM 7366]|uniref:uncharacterized protein n=1 Tax=Sodiomyces alcalophilus JCM 7366 TaxID=591952 RepID=UPI0039B5708C
MALNANTLLVPDEPTAPEGAWLSPARGPYPAGAPLIRPTPDTNADSSTAYDEDEFVALWHQIYRIFLRLSYLKEEDVVFPPEDTGRHADIKQDRLRREFNMSDRAISLLERLPYPTKGAGGYDGVMFAPFGMVFNYLHADEYTLRTCRDPHYQNQLANGRDDPSPDYLYPDDVALLTPFESDGMCWILDTKTNAIRTLQDMVEYNSRAIPDDFIDERPDNQDHYRNWPGFDATFLLKRYIRDLWSLKFVPLDNGQYITDTSFSIESLLIARKLQTEYGWPDDFRADAWRLDADRVRHAAAEKSDQVTQGRGGMDKQSIERWKTHPEEMPELVVPDSDVH